MAEEMKNDINSNVNDLACDLAKVLYKNQFSALEKTLERFHVPNRFYSLFTIKNETTCMLYSEGEWTVFFSERGMRTGEKRFDNPGDACLSLLYAMAETNAEYQQMERYYKHELDSNPSSEVSSPELYRVVRDGLKRIASSVAAL